MEENPEFQNDEGARPSSLISIHKLSRPDPLHDLQLLRDLSIINERTERELGPRTSTPAEPIVKRKPRIAHLENNKACGHDALPTEKEEVMKMTPLVAALALCAGGSTACAGDIEELARPERASNVASNQAQEGRLGPEYKEISSFTEFRKKLLQDGWTPVPNPECMEVVAGSDYQGFCKKWPDSASCRICEIVPEIFRSTGDGYSLMRYKKNGAILGVSIYGDDRGFLEPKYDDLMVTGWHYDGSINVFLLDEADVSSGVDD